MTDRRCPGCDSPNPALHPAVQYEGEVEPCADEWHDAAIDRQDAWVRKYIAEKRAKR